MIKKVALILCLQFACLALTTALVSADDATSVWTSLGLNGGRVQALAVAPTDPTTLFSGIYMGQGLFHSTDGAATWQALKLDHFEDREGTFENHSVYAVAVAPNNPQVVWAAHNYWVAKSTDGGNTWDHVPSTPMQKTCGNCTEGMFRLCLAIAIDPHDAETVFVGTSGPDGVSTNGAVYRTTDGGGTWEKLNGGSDFDYAVVSVSLHAQKPGLIWTATSSWGVDGVWDGTAYMSIDSGDSFSSPDPKPIYGDVLSGVTCHPGDPDVVFVTGGVGVVRMVIDDTSWHPELAVDGGARATPVAFAPSDENKAYVGWNRPKEGGGDGQPKFSRSSDGGQTWETLRLDPVMASTPNCIVVDPHHADTIYWGDASGGVLKSQDSGETWKPVNQNLEGVIVFDVDSDPRSGDHLIAGTTGGVYERVDAQWHKRLNRLATSVRFDPDDSRSYYAGLWNALAKTRDEGRNWSYSNDTGDGYIYHIDIDPRDTNTLFIADQRQIRRSTDGGNSFTAVLAGINSNGEAHYMNVVAIDPSNSQRILAGGGNFYAPKVLGGLWESLDGGETWQVTGLTDVIVNDVLIHPENPALLYAGCGYSSRGMDTPLFKSADGGSTWSAAIDGLTPEVLPLQAVWVSETGDIFALGAWSPIVHVVDGRVETFDPGIDENLHDVFGIDGETVFAVGDKGTILKYDGSRWAVMESPVDDVDLWGIWGISKDQLYAVGQQGRILFFNGREWSVMTSPVDTTLLDVFGTAGDAVFAVGDAGTMLRYDGHEWTRIASPTDDPLLTVWGAGGNHWFAAGDNGTIVAFDGNAGTVMNSGTDEIIMGLWGNSQDDVYAVTRTPGTLLHFDGKEWHSIPAPRDYLSDINGASGQGIYVVQGNGGIFRYDGAQWTTLRLPGSGSRAVTDLEFHRTNPTIVYAATYQAGVHLSPNQGGHWLNLGVPRLNVNAIAVGSLYAATGGGLYQLTGTGVLAGRVYDNPGHAIIEDALVATDLGQQSAIIDGLYMFVVPAGIFDVYATADQHEMAVTRGVSVVGGDITWQDFEMRAGISTADSPNGPLTIDTDKSGGGSYCFISTCSSFSMAGFFLGPFCLAVGLVLSTGWLERRWIARLLLIGAVGFFAAVPQALASTIFQQVGVTSPPLPVGSGARAMGMGGAFIAIADDATAASWNPAGLVQVERPEMSIVGDGYSREESFTSGAHPEVNNTGHNDHCNFNYFSVTFPVHWRKRFVFSVNYQRLYDFNRDLNFRRNLAEQDLQLDQQIKFDQSGTVGAVGLAGAVELTPSLSLGLTVNIWTDQLGYDNGWKSHYLERASGSQAGVPTTLDTRIQDNYEQFRGINANLGLLWDINHWGAVGVVVKTPFKATIQHHFRLNQIQTYGEPLNTRTNNGPVQVDEEVELHLPLSYGVGWSKRFSDRFTMGVDIYRTEWSGYYLEDGQGDEFSPIDGRRRSDSDVDDTTHLRLGGEYLLLWPHKKIAVPIRMGFFYDPEPSEGHPQDVLGAALGVGYTHPRYSIDLAYQLRWAEEIDSGNIIATSAADIIQHTVSASLIYYF